MGNIGGTIYYLCFQAAGLISMRCLFPRERLLSRLLSGSVTGSLLFAWLPALFSFFFDFTPLSHMLALGAAALLAAAAAASGRVRKTLPPYAKEPEKEALKPYIPFAVLLFLTIAFWCLLLHTHTLLPGKGGDLRTGQCTYGDMNMHLGFVTSLARQGAFPPDYSIMPGVRLSYPFLSDSVSSSLYLLGMSLRAAYILPMIFAMAQIFTAVYLFALEAPRASSHFPAGLSPASDQAPPRAHRTALFALLLFFCNGGLGFAYFFDRADEAAYRFSDIFTGFYTTPTNLIEKNIRWVNIIADMLLPQRATLFGYAVLFPALWLLYRAAFRNRREYFPLAALWVAALPMIHTHSFLSAGVVSAVWLLLWLLRQNAKKRLPEGSLSDLSRYTARKQIHLAKPAHTSGGWIFALFLVLMCLLQAAAYSGNHSDGLLFLLSGLGLFAAALVPGIFLLCTYIRSHGYRILFASWGIYLILILCLALPQLLFWTFGQVAEGGFVRGHFGWGNQGDFYLWFYIKNIGAPLLLTAGAVCTCGRRNAPLFLPALFLWWLGELVVFTPNTYDNNKLLYTAYFLLCLGAADYGCLLYDKIKSIPGCRFLAASFLLCSSLSGMLTLGREAVSDYCLYSASQAALAEYIEENTPPDAVFLTDTRHNNEISSLTGRSIVCGADTFLYYHGLDTTERKEDLLLMYEAPLEHSELFDKYNVSYVVISRFERSSFHVDEDFFRTCCQELFSFGDTLLYKIPPQKPMPRQQTDGASILQRRLHGAIRQNPEICRIQHLPQTLTSPLLLHASTLLVPSP